MSNNREIFTLNNGLRIVAAKASGAVSYIGVAINAGSRNDPDSFHGLAHFVEHTIFKGTDKRPAYRIANRMESVGGELNAYTSKEETMVYTTAMAGYTERAFELLGDIIANSRFPKDEIDRERDVVTEEIYSYKDSPSDSVYDDFEELLYNGSDLAHNILGTPDSVRNIKTTDCRNFLDDYYTPSNMVIYCVDNNKPEKILKLANRHFGSLHYKTKPTTALSLSSLSPFDEVRSNDSFQANTIIGQRIFGRRDPRRFALFLMNNYLGGPCMNSLLNRELREKRGFVYTVDSSVSLLRETGSLMIYFGCDPERVDICSRIINNEIDRLAQKPLTAAKLDKIKRQYIGQLALTADNFESQSMALAKSLLYYDVIHDINYTTQRINDVSSEQILEVAQILNSSPLSRLTLSPVSTKNTKA